MTIRTHITVGKAVKTGAPRTYRFTFSDDTVDLVGDRISASGWDLSSYKANSVVLFGHKSDELPIGKATNVRVAGNRLLGDIQFASDEYPFAATVERLVASGYLSACSVGFVPLEAAQSDRKGGGIDFKRQRLLEVSIVPCPANTNCLVDGKTMTAGVLMKSIPAGIHGEAVRRAIMAADTSTIEQRAAAAFQLKHGYAPGCRYDLISGGK